MHMNTRGWHTAEALPAIIAELSKQGFRFVTVTELLTGGSGTESQAEGNGTIKGTVVNLRQEPSTDSEIVATLEAGARVAVQCSVVGEAVAGYGTDVWYRIEHEGVQAYVLSALVALEEEVASCE
jgi:hypothetical protein